uniref:Uncharacterized protein n=1 Tax=Anguilla anguilla TaxID=7936 RepID=A0A0E9R564_ANGAN
MKQQVIIEACVCIYAYMFLKVVR